MRKIWLILLVLMLALVPTAAFANDGGCEDGCDMEVDIDVSGNSEVNVNTGNNSEVEVNTGANNDVYINGQDINEPTVIHRGTTKTVKLPIGINTRQRISKLEWWKKETTGVLQLTMDGLAKLIVQVEDRGSDLPKLRDKLTTSLSIIRERQEVLSEADNAIKEELLSLNTESELKIDALSIEVDNLKQQLGDNFTSTLWITIGLAAALSCLGALLFRYSRRKV